MSGPDSVEALCRSVYMRNVSGKFGNPRYTSSVNSQELRTLLEAMLKMLPVVRAAEALNDAVGRNRDITTKMLALNQAIDQMRAAGGGE